MKSEIATEITLRLRMPHNAEPLIILWLLLDGYILEEEKYPYVGFEYTDIVDVVELVLDTAREAVGRELFDATLDAKLKKRAVVAAEYARKKATDKAGILE